jgi:protein subunit release factor A
MREEILKTIKWSEYPERPKGGQSCGIMIHGVTLKSEELDFSVSVSWHKSQLKNKEECMKLFEAYVDSLIFQNQLGW